jgi:hypothetical protein
MGRKEVKQFSLLVSLWKIKLITAVIGNPTPTRGHTHLPVPMAAHLEVRRFGHYKSTSFKTGSEGEKH